MGTQAMKTDRTRPNIYDGEGDRLMEEKKQNTAIDRIILLPDAPPSPRPDPNPKPKLRIMWGQHLLEDLLLGRYRSLVCAVNAQDNSRGIITNLAELLPTSQWTETSITALAKQFSVDSRNNVRVIKYDMDSVEVLALLRPPQHDHLSLQDLAHGFRIAAEMIRRQPSRQPSASVSFLGGRSNALKDPNGHEPSFETVLRVMDEAGFIGDVYPAPSMWTSAPTAVFARYPFPDSLETMRHGGF
jgi:hypothetical protein